MIAKLKPRGHLQKNNMAKQPVKPGKMPFPPAKPGKGKKGC